jgi:hypothetical protein
MKKVLPYIFILLIITTFLAPFGVGISMKGKVEVRGNVTNACNTSKDIATGVVTLIDCGDSTGKTPPQATNPDNPGFLQTISCGLTSIGGCVVSYLLYPIFTVTSYLFELSGKFFDFAFDYSVTDTSYRSPFVVQGWGIVRDFVNMFFIFVLLYVAISTILGVHGFNTKSMIINVVIIGLVINFSLFIPQVIVDTSNILARVFYNSDSISVKDSNGKRASLSAAIVNKVQPQNLIINAGDITRTDPVTGKTTTTNTAQLDLVSALLILTLIIAVNIVGIVVFMSTALVFIGRVIGLWLACIFAPFAFFSYTVPAMEGIQLVGWKHWWPDTLKQAFLAPVFIFFLYLILRFLSTIDIFRTSITTTGTDFILGVMVPFVFIMMLMWKAKDIAKDMSGTIGDMASKLGTSAAGLALGAATGGASLAGRGSLGRLASKVTGSDYINNTAAGLDADGKPMKDGGFSRFKQFSAGFVKSGSSKVASSSFDARQTAVGNAASKALGVDLNQGLGALGLNTTAGLGGFAGARERKKAEEDTFGKSLGYDHHQYEDQEKTIREAEDALNKHKTDTTIDHNTKEYKGEKARLELELKKEEKRLEIIKSGREKEYALSVRKKSGNLYKEVVRDDKTGYIKRFGEATEPTNYGVDIKGEKVGIKGDKEITIDFLKGLAKGALQGGIAGAAAGSIIPGYGTLAGAGYGSLAGAVKQLLERDRGALKAAGEASHDHKDSKDNYKPGAPASSAPSSGGGGGGHDDHGGGGQGGH